MQGGVRGCGLGKRASGRLHGEWRRYRAEDVPHLLGGRVRPWGGPAGCVDQRAAGRLHGERRAGHGDRLGVCGGKMVQRGYQYIWVDGCTALLGIKSVACEVAGSDGSVLVSYY